MGIPTISSVSAVCRAVARATVSALRMRTPSSPRPRPGRRRPGQGAGGGLDPRGVAGGAWKSGRLPMVAPGSRCFGPAMRNGASSGIAYRSASSAPGSSTTVARRGRSLSGTEKASESATPRGPVTSSRVASSSVFPEARRTSSSTR